MIETYYKISNIRYKKNPSYNCVLTSKEKKVVVGTVRMIAGELLYCREIDYGYEPTFWTIPDVGWQLVSVGQLPNDDEKYDKKKLLTEQFFKKLENGNY
jgi:hypothetical protein